MGLTMRERQSVTRETAQRYRKADKKDEQSILDQFTRTTRYNRKYAISLLSNWGKKKLRTADGKPLRFIVGKPCERLSVRSGSCLITCAASVLPC